MKPQTETVREERATPLLPCPFCGDDCCQLVSNGIESVFASCIQCGAEGPCMETNKQAAKAWNDRRDARLADALKALEVMTELCTIKYGNLDKDVWDEIVMARRVLGRKGS